MFARNPIPTATRIAAATAMRTWISGCRLNQRRGGATGIALADTLNVAGFSLECLKRPAEARPYLERSLAMNPAQPAVKQALGIR